jgi:hypothetical protein
MRPRMQSTSQRSPSSSARSRQSGPLARSAHGTAVILFAEIVDSTGLTERLGNEPFRDRARALDEALRAAIRDAGGTPVEGKLLGGGVLAVFASAREALEAAVCCRDRSGYLPWTLRGSILPTCFCRLRCHMHSRVFEATVSTSKHLAGLTWHEGLRRDVHRLLTGSSIHLPAVPGHFQLDPSAPPALPQARGARAPRTASERGSRPGLPQQCETSSWNRTSR